MFGIILLGQSNSGKSTIGKGIAKKLNVGDKSTWIRYISSGDIARNMTKDGIQDDLKYGMMAPEDEMRKSILENINSSNTPYILDGFPRFYDQYEWLNQQVNHDLIYIFIDVPDDEVLRRAHERCRCDDESICKKLEFYREATFPMIRDIISSRSETVYIINNGSETDVDTNINSICENLSHYLEGI